MPNKDTTPLSLYGNDREYLREQEKTNELLAEIAGEEYESPGDIPKGKYIVQKRLLDAAQKKNELLEAIAEGSGGGSGAAKALGIDYATDVISLKNKDGATIEGSGATLPAYGVSFDPTTGGLTLTKNGTAVQGQTVTIPNYGSPVGVTDSADMVDEGAIYLYEGETGGGFTNGHFYYYDGTAWADGGEYAAATVQTDKTLLVENRAADAKATGEAVGELKTQTNAVNSGVTDGLAQYGNDMFGQGDWSTSTVATKVNSTKAIRIEHPITIHAGDKLITKPGTKATYMGWNLWNANGEKVETGYEYTTYKRTIQDKTVTFAHDGTLEISVANGPNPGNSSAITPDDMDAVVIIQNSLAKRIEAELTDYEGATDNSIDELYEFTTTEVIDETPSASEPDTLIYYPYHFKAGQTYIAHIKFTAFSSAGNRKYSLRTTTGQYISSAYTVQGFAVVDGTNPVIGEEYVYKIVAKTKPDGSEGQYLAIEINSKSGELSEAELKVYSIKAEDTQTELDKLDYITATDIVSLNHDLPMRIAEGNKPLMNATTYPLKLLHFSDLHGDATNLQRIVDLKNYLGAKIDDTICTGDMVYNNYSATCMDFWDGVDGAENILMVVGNHELADGQHGYGSDQIGQTLAYEKYISPYVSNWNVTLAGTNLTYWFKDYAARKVRLIGLNYLLTGDELTAQNTWLAERLAEAKAAGHAVVIAEHCPGNAFTNIDCGFSVIGHPWTYSEFPVSIQETVQTFIDGGGEFACYLCGHSHRDYVGYNSNFPNQLFIVVTCAFPNATSNDMYRAVGTKAQDAANIVFVDTVTKTVKLVRVGADTDCYLRGRNLLSVRYTDKAIIADS